MLTDARWPKWTIGTTKTIARASAYTQDLKSRGALSNLKNGAVLVICFLFKNPIVAKRLSSTCTIFPSAAG